MRFPFRKTIIITLSIAVFGTVGSSIWLQNSKPKYQPEPHSPQTSSPQDISPLAPITSQQLKTATKESVVRFDGDTGKQAFISANNLAPGDLKPVAELPNTYTITRSPGQLTAVGALITEQKKYVALLVPNDPIYPQWYTDKISAPGAWDISTGSSNMIVADIDTGFALNHEDLASRWASGGKDFVHNDNDPSTGTTSPNSNEASHGTETAGLIGASGNNAKGVASINWGAKILPLQALDDNGIGTTTAVASAVHYAVDQGAKVINMSLGGTSPDPILKAELDYAQSHDVVVVAAAGNCGSTNSYFLSDCSVAGQMIYPANYPQVLAVGATDINDNRASFSSYGPNLDVMAPGSGTISTPTWTPSNQTGLYTTSLNGTSFSSPIAAGLAALYRGLRSNSTVSETINAITANADKVSGMAGQNFTNDYGFGRINALRVASAATAAAPSPTIDSSSATLISGGILHKDDYLISTDGRSVLSFQRNGNLALYANFKLVWETGALGSAAERVIMQPDGNLVVYDSSNRALWSTTTDGNPGARLTIQTNGDLVIYSSSGTALWATHTSNNPDLSSDVNSIMAPGVGGIARMYPGQSIPSSSRHFRLILQSDGNLVLYSPTRALWSSGTDGRSAAFLALQPDGNLVLYDRSALPLWASYTDRFGLTRLIMQPDGNLVLYDQSNVAHWNTGTAGAL